MFARSGKALTGIGALALCLMIIAAQPPDPIPSQPSAPSVLPPVVPSTGQPPPAPPKTDPNAPRPLPPAGVVPPSANAPQTPPVPTPEPVPPPSNESPAIIVVQVPTNATIWIENQQMKQTGTLRSYRSPPLELGKSYYYTFTVSWPVPGQPDYKKEYEVTVKPGETLNYNFNTQTTVVPQTTQPYYAPPRRFFRYEGSGY